VSPLLQQPNGVQKPPLWHGLPTVPPSPTAGLHTAGETCGRRSGLVRGPSHNGPPGAATQKGPTGGRRPPPARPGGRTMRHLSDEDRANLVAYLDGELDEASAQALEAKLNTDPRARAEAETLRRTWELLDYLPRAEVSTSFTHRTLERLAVRTASGPA